MCQELCGSDSCLPLSASGYSLHREYYLDLRVRSAASATVACPEYRTKNASRAVGEFSCCAFVGDGHPAAVAARHSLWMDATGVGAPSTSALLVSTILCATGCRDQLSPGKQRASGPSGLPFLPVVCGREGERRRFGSEGLFGDLPGYHRYPCRPETLLRTRTAVPRRVIVVVVDTYINTALEVLQKYKAVAAVAVPSGVGVACDLCGCRTRARCGEVNGRCCLLSTPLLYAVPMQSFVRDQLPSRLTACT